MCLCMQTRRPTGVGCATNSIHPEPIKAPITDDVTRKPVENKLKQSHTGVTVTQCYRVDDILSHVEQK